MVLAMPNTKPPIFDAETLDLALDAARQKARCDYAQYLGAGPDNADWDAHPDLPHRAAGSEDVPRPDLRPTAPGRHDSLAAAFQPLAEGPTHRGSFREPDHGGGHPDGAIYDRPVHIAHISLREEVLLIKAAKERGIKVTCEVAPHHLFLTKDDPYPLSHLPRDIPDRGKGDAPR